MSVIKRKTVDVTADTEESCLSDTSSGAKRAPVSGPMTKYMLSSRDNTLQATIARMTSRDGLPFKPFVTSPDLRKCLLALGFGNLPTSCDTVKQMVMSEGRNVRSFAINQLARKKSEGHRFSLSLDEWTSGRNRRYMNINVHEKGGAFWSLGLVRVNGSMPADKCASIIDSKLNEFGLSLAADIVCIVTDGASVMVKAGTLTNTEHQLCYAHGVQLAVLDVLYRRHERATPAVATHSAPDATECEDNSDDGEDCDADEVAADQHMEVVDDDYDVLVEMSTTYQDVVQKVRKVVKLFKRSPTKNDSQLQPYVKQECGREITLLLDCKTRWNSLVDMLSRFLQLRGPVQKALIDLGQASLINDGDFTVVQEMVSCLEPLKLAVSALCRRDTNLLSGEAAQFLSS